MIDRHFLTGTSRVCPESGGGAGTFLSVFLSGLLAGIDVMQRPEENHVHHRVQQAGLEGDVFRHIVPEEGVHQEINRRKYGEEDQAIAQGALHPGGNHGAKVRNGAGPRVRGFTLNTFDLIFSI